MFKNCILITIDSLRADHLGCYGYKNIKTPNIDELSFEGVKFTNAYANSPGTPSSFPAILSSTYPMMYGGYGRLSKLRPYIPEVIKDENGKIYTIGINSNPFLSRHFGYHRGFDFFYDDILSTKKVNRKLIKKGKRLIYTFLGAPPYTTGYALNKIAKKQIERAKNNPFFMWIHYMDVHVSYVYKNRLKNIIYHKKLKGINRLVIDVARGRNYSVPENKSSEVIKLYDEGVKRVDDIVGDLTEFLQKKGILDNTLIILTADHGEEFMEHGGLCHMPKLYDELLHIPLIISSPSLERKKVTKLVDHLDLAPTIAETLNVKSDVLWFGRSLLSKIKSKNVISEVANTVTSAEVQKEEWKITVRNNRWKLHFYVKNNRFELYDIVNDPSEKEDVSKEEEEVFQKLKLVVDAHVMLVKKTFSETQRIKKSIKKLKSKGKI